MASSVVVTGLKELHKDVKKTTEKKFWSDVMKWAAKNAENRAKALCPVADSIYAHAGKLMKHIHSDYDHKSFTLFTDEAVPYAFFNEYGSITTPVYAGKLTPAVTSGFRPFIRPAMIDTISDLEEVIGEKIFTTISY